MSTPNFNRQNASKIYAVLMNDYDEETGQVNYPDELESEMFMEDVQQSIKSKMEEAGYNVYTGIHHIDNNRSYPQVAIATIQSEKCFIGDDCYLGVAIVATVNSGYYEGASLDYKYEITGEHNTIDSLDQLDDFLDDLIEDETEYVNIPEGKIKLKKRMKDWVERTQADITEKLEALYSDIAQAELYCTAIFSNGEALYEKA